jgi:hypothetical protein
VGVKSKNTINTKMIARNAEINFFIIKLPFLIISLIEKVSFIIAYGQGGYNPISSMTIKTILVTNYTLI